MFNYVIIHNESFHYIFENTYWKIKFDLVGVENSKFKIQNFKGNCQKNKIALGLIDKFFYIFRLFKNYNLFTFQRFFKLFFNIQFRHIINSSEPFRHFHSIFHLLISFLLLIFLMLLRVYHHLLRRGYFVIFVYFDNFTGLKGLIYVHILQILKGVSFILPSAVENHHDY